MKIKLLVYLLCLATFSYSQNSLSWYKLIEGTIDKYAITMHLHKAGHNYYGYYYYSQQKPIYFNGDDTSISNKIYLTAFTSNDAYETFSFEINNSGITGKWKKDEKSPDFSFLSLLSFLSFSGSFCGWTLSEMISNENC